MSEDSLRVPPHNVEAERAILGAIMIDQNAFARIADIIKPEDFYKKEHGEVFKAMLNLYDKNMPLDILSVNGLLKERGSANLTDDTGYLANLVNSVATSSNIAYYATIVKKKKILRDLIDTSYHIGELGYREDEDVDLLIDDAEKAIFSISQNSLKQNFIPVKEALADAWERINLLHEQKGMLRGVETGFSGLDNILAGLQRSNLIVLAARPSLGKTSLSLDIARHVGVHQKKPVAIFSLEMSKHELIDRFIAAESRVSLWHLRTGKLSESSDDFAQINDAMARLADAPIYIDDEVSNTVLKMKTMARRLQTENPLSLIIIDYLQLMQPRQASDSMVQQITEISRSLKALARELDVPVLAISQLSRAVEQRHPPIPRLSDLRESGAIEQDADVVMFIYREDKTKKDSTRQNIADIFIEKHRNGPTGKIELYFNSDYTSFSSLDETFL